MHNICNHFYQYCIHIGLYCMAIILTVFYIYIYIYIYSCVVYDQTTFECFDQIFWPISPLIRENVGEDNHIYSFS